MKPSRSLINVLQSRPHATGVEVGVWRGDMARKLLEHFPDLQHLYAVDPWRTFDDYDEKKNDTALLDAAFATCVEYSLIYTDAGRMTILRETSVEAARHLPDAAFDFVYIDANHSYEHAAQDVRLWLPKVKPGGILAGHDYRRDRFGVKRAIDEMFGFDNVNKAGAAVWWVPVDAES